MLKDKKIIIATHVYTTGPAQDLKEYLLNNKIDELLFIGHPLFYDKKLRGSGYELYTNGEVKVEKYTVIKKVPEVLSYIKDVALNIIYVFKTGKKWDLYVGSDNLNALSGVILKLLGKVAKTVYYVIDYNPKRFQNKILNNIYQKVDQLCVTHCDETWNLSPRMEMARKEYFNYGGGNQKVVPVGVWLDRINAPRFEEAEKHTMVFMGHVIEKQGVQHVLNAIPKIAKSIPDFKFLVIGGGNYLDKLKDQAEKLGIQDHVTFTGYVKEHTDIERMLSRCSVAIALYDKYDENGNISFTYFSDPAKLKTYLACGLPVLLTDIPYNAKEIQKNGCGKIITTDAESVAVSVVEVMENETKLKEYRDNGLGYSRKYNWNDIFGKVLKQSVEI